MPSTKPLLDQLIADHPDITFTASDSFAWQPHTRTITYDVSDVTFYARLLHELGHALLEHTEYSRDIELIAMERDAWRIARIELGPRYDIPISADTVHDDMDTYRDWLHARSTCPKCQSNGIEIKQQSYRCVSCQHKWRVNEARSCQLKRYS